MAKDVIINFKGNMDISQMKSSLDGFQKVLAGLKLPSDLSKNLVDGFQKANAAVDQIEKRLANGFKTNSDVSGLGKDFDKLDKIVEDLNKDIGKISDNHIKLSIDTKEIKQAQKYAADLRKQLNQRIEADGLKEVNKAVNELHQGISKSKGIERFQEAFKSGNIEEASRALKQLIDNSNAFSDSVKKATYDQKIKIFAQALDNLKKDNAFQKINQEIQVADGNVKKLSDESISKLKNAFNGAAKGMQNLPNAIKGSKDAAVEAADGIRQMNSEIDGIKQRIVYFFSLTNSIQLLKKVISSSFETIKELDKAMTETAVVTNFDIGDMWEQLPTYSAVAKELGVTISGVYEATTLFYQQGLNTSQAFALGTESLKMARIAGLDYEEATNRMTAALRGFNMELNETSAQRVNDVYSKLAAITASDTDEISTAMTKTAAIANSVGMSFEVASAFLAQGIEATRESADTIGTAMKTVLARFTEMKKAESDIINVDGEEISVNKVEAALKSVGIQLRDTNGEFRDMDDVFLELSSKWNSLSVMSQRYVATMAAGSRQQSRFIAMMSDYGRTMELVNAANESAGASQEQYEKTLDSLDAKLNQLKTSWQLFTMNLANSDMIKKTVDFLGGFLDKINSITNSTSGFAATISKIFLAFGAIQVLKPIFSKMFTSFIGAGKEAAHFFGQSFTNNLKSIRIPNNIGKKLQQEINQSLKQIVINKGRNGLKELDIFDFGSAIDKGIKNAETTLPQATAKIPSLMEKIETTARNAVNVNSLDDEGKAFIETLIQGMLQAIQNGQVTVEEGLRAFISQVEQKSKKDGLNVAIDTNFNGKGATENFDKTRSSLAGITQAAGLASGAISGVISLLDKDAKSPWLAGLQSGFAGLSAILITMPTAINAVKLAMEAAAKGALTLGTAMTAAFGVVGIIATVVSAIFSVISAVKQAKEAAKQLEIDSKNKTIDSYFEEAETVQQLIEEYKNLKDQYLESGEGKKEFEQQVYKVAEALGLERAEVAGLIDDIDALNKKLAQAQWEKFQTDTSENFENIDNKIDEGKANSEKGRHVTYSKYTSEKGKKREEARIKNGAAEKLPDYTDLEKKYGVQASESGFLGDGSLRIDYEDNAQGFANYVKFLKELKQRLIKAGKGEGLVVERITEILSSLEDATKAYDEAASKLQDDLVSAGEAALTLQGKNIDASETDLSKIEDAKQTFIEKLKSTDAYKEGKYTNADIEKAANQYLINIGGTAGSIGQIDSFLSSLEQKIKDNNLSDDVKNKIEAKIKEFKNSGQYAAATRFISEIDFSTLNSPLDIDKIIEQLSSDKEFKESQKIVEKTKEVQDLSDKYKNLIKAVNDLEVKTNQKQTQLKGFEDELDFNMEFKEADAEEIAHTIEDLYDHGIVLAEAKDYVADLNIRTDVKDFYADENFEKKIENGEKKLFSDIEKKVGNVDLELRAKAGIQIEWDEENIKKWKGIIPEELQQGVSTVLGAWDTFKVPDLNISQDIAYTPIIKTPDGKVGVATAEVITEYMQKVLSEAHKRTQKDPNLKLEDAILQVDKEKKDWKFSIDVGNGKQEMSELQNIIAGVGEEAAEASVYMHTLEFGKGIQNNVRVINSLQKKIKDIDNELKNSDSALTKNKSKLEQQREALEKVIDELVEYEWAQREASISTSDTLTSLNQISGGLDELAKVYNDVRDGGEFNWESLTSKNFVEEFGKYTKEYNHLIDVISNSPGDINACQAAFNNLTHAYVHGSDALVNVTDKTRQLAINTLKSKGIANAAAIVDAELAAQKEALAAKARLSANITLDEAVAMTQSKKTAQANKNALVDLVSAKVQVGQITINTTGDIANLAALSVQAGRTTKSLIDMAKAKMVAAKKEADLYQETSNSFIGENGRIYDPAMYADSKKRSSKASKEYKAWLETYNAIKDLPTTYSSTSGGNASNTTFKPKNTSGSKKSGSNSSKKSSEKGTYSGDIYKEYQDNIDETAKRLEKLQKVYENLANTQGTTYSQLLSNINQQISALKKEIEQEQTLLNLRKKERNSAVSGLNKAAGRKISWIEADGSIHIEEAQYKAIIQKLDTSSNKYKKLTDAYSRANTADSNFMSAVDALNNLKNELNSLNKVPPDLKAIKTLIATKWYNYFDVAEDIINKIADEQRRFEKLQNDYAQKVKGGATAQELSKIWVEQYKNLFSRKNQEEEAYSLYKANWLDVYRTIQNSKTASKYISFDKKNFEVSLDEDALRASKLSDEELQTISDLFGTVKNLSDKIDDTEDTINDLNNTIKDWENDYKSIEDEFLHTLYDADLKAIDDEIEALEQVNSSIEEQTSDLLSGIRDALAKERQARENAERQKNLADKETRLAYLKRDTTGSNAVEIAQLEKELEQDRQDYVDNLIDQRLDEMEDSLNEATEQRQEQIDTLNEIRDNLAKNPDWNKYKDQLAVSIDSAGHIKEGSDLEAAILSKMDDQTAHEKEQAVKEAEEKAKEMESKKRAQEYIDSNKEQITNAGKGQVVSNPKKAGYKTGEQVYFATKNDGTYKGVVQNNGDVLVKGNGTFAIYRNLQETESGLVETDKSKIYHSKQDAGFSSKTAISTKGYTPGQALVFYDEKGNYKGGAYMGGNKILKVDSGFKGYEIYDNIYDAGGILRSASDKKDKSKHYTVAEIAKYNGISTSKKSNEQIYREIQNYLKNGGTLKTSAGSTSSSTGTKQSTKTNTSTSTNTSTTSYYKKYQGTSGSIVDALKAIGVDSSYDNRKKIAKANGISNYSSSAEQNIKMLKLLKDGKLKKYASGGLVTETGLAWLDGSKFKPEYVLNPKQTESFIKLTNIAEGLMKNIKDVNTGHNSNQPSNATFNIVVKVDKMSSDYDVDQAVNRAKQAIVSAAGYRNVQSLNFKR